MVRLRPPAESDVAVFFAHQLDPEANRMAAFSARDPKDREGFVARWARLGTDPNVLVRAIEHEGAPAGYVASFLRGEDREVSYWLGRAHWGKGIATAALAELLREETRRPLFARAAADNVASLRVLEKCGFVALRRERAFANARGAEIEEIVLRLTR